MVVLVARGGKHISTAVLGKAGETSKTTIRFTAARTAAGAAATIQQQELQQQYSSRSCSNNTAAEIGNFAHQFKHVFPKAWILFIS